MTERRILTINGGSSSIKFALYEVRNPLARTLSGKIDRIGSPGTNLTFLDPADGQTHGSNIQVTGYRAAARFLVEWLEQHSGTGEFHAAGHRIVHGMHHAEPAAITPGLLDELRGMVPYAPDHLPGEIHLIEAFAERYPALRQVACFDTAFHAHMPRCARLLPIPRRFDAMGVKKYGFHGISYSYLIEELARLNPAEARGRVILAHLGNGCSLAAVRDGESLDTTMGFTPAAGLPMGNRTGDLDPGVAWYLMRTESLTPDQFNDLINHQSGLLGVSETSSDMRDLVERMNTDLRAAEAVELFCYRAKRWIGAFAAVLDGLDTLVFAGGIGENSPLVRERICSGLGFLGVQLDPAGNGANRPVISANGSKVAVRIIPTDEEQMIARSVLRLVGDNT